ncbi:MAG: N-acetyl-gamma-glutamyl-phosphate reductase, partial [Chloroflexi bacterium]|nr:N-acetyl-gamma-glutamyl-phosphate reductase [Chloroflexota bacterium]
EARRRGSSLERLALTFIPHLIPMTRGILSTCYAKLTEPMDTAAVRRLFQERYAGEPFVRVADAPPQTKQTWGSNHCIVYPTVDTRTNRLIVISCLDNLVKGASGQAIQNMNIMFGLDERLGIDHLGTYP